MRRDPRLRPSPVSDATSAVTTKRPTVLHPYLFGVFPILFLYAQNAGEMRAHHLIGPLIIVSITTGVLMAMLTRISRSPQMVGVAVSTLLLLFFSYGYVFHWLELRTEQLQTSRNQWAMLFGSLLVFAVVFRVLQVLGEKTDHVTSLLNVVAAGLVLVQFVTAGIALAGRQRVEAQSTEWGESRGAAWRKPDIFFVLLDGYARQDVLGDLYDFDNRPFLTALEDQGFKVARDSRAPYIQTLLSLAAIFNLGYQQDFAPALDSQSTDRVGLSESIWNGTAIRSLEDHGYSTASFASGYTMTEFRGADRYLVPGDGLGEFSRLLISTTPLQVILDAGSRATRHRNRIEYIFQTLPRLGGNERPLFVLAHVISPHPPFVLGDGADARSGSRWFGMADGSHRVLSAEERARYRRQYKEQLAIINGLVEQTVGELLARPREQQPVIIIASDHGPGSELRWYSMEESDLRERLGSLFAIYLPDAEVAEELPEPMTPVNAFRILFNRYLGSDYSILPARSYFSTWEEPYALTEVDEAQIDFLPPPGS